MKAKEIDYELMDEWFYYDETSPSGLRWKRTHPKASRVKVGSIAGHLLLSRNRKSWVVRLLGVPYQVHRIVFTLFYKSLPSELIIDHVNVDSTDNRISNLRSVPQKMNSRNKRKSVHNLSGVTGVSVVDGHCKASWKDLDGASCGKSFSVNKYGEEEAFRLACQAREEAIKRLNEQGAGYTETHGEELVYSK